MKLSKKLNHRNLDGIFRLILLTCGEQNAKKCVKTYVGQLKKIHDRKFDKKQIFQQVKKIELIN